MEELSDLRAEVMRSIDRSPDPRYAAFYLAVAFGQLVVTLALVPPLAASGSLVAMALAIFLVGIAQYHLYFPLHDVCHASLLRTPGGNRRLGRFISGLLVNSFHTFTAIHMDHHRTYGTQRDTGSMDYWVRFDSRREMASFFLLPVLGVFERLRLNFLRPLSRWLGREPDVASRPADAFRPPKVPFTDVAWIAGCQLLLFLVLSAGGARPFDYVLYWIVPEATVFMVLARLRMYLEHGPLDYAVSDYLGDAPRKIARTHGPPQGALSLLSALCFRFHAEHHLVPQMPSCRLPEVYHRFTRERLDPDDWSPSYLESLRRLWRLPSTRRLGGADAPREGGA